MIGWGLRSQWVTYKRQESIIWTCLKDWGLVCAARSADGRGWRCLECSRLGPEQTVNRRRCVGERASKTGGDTLTNQNQSIYLSQWWERPSLTGQQINQNTGVSLTQVTRSDIFSSQDTLKWWKLSWRKISCWLLFWRESVFLPPTVIFMNSPNPTAST